MDPNYLGKISPGGRLRLSSATRVADRDRQGRRGDPPENHAPRQEQQGQRSPGGEKDDGRDPTAAVALEHVDHHVAQGGEQLAEGVFAHGDLWAGNGRKGGGPRGFVGALSRPGIQASPTRTDEPAARGPPQDRQYSAAGADAKAARKNPIDGSRARMIFSPDRPSGSGPGSPAFRLAFRPDFTYDNPYSSLTVENVTERHSHNLLWDQGLRKSLLQRKAVVFSPERVRPSQYRPYVKQHCYFGNIFIHRKGQMYSIFPSADSTNRAICVPGVGSTKPFSTLMVDTMPDLHFVAFGQCFPRYRYQEPADSQGTIPGIKPELERIDNITDIALRAFRVRYNDNTITKDAIFDYIYGVLHAPNYRERFANDLSKEMPRVPFVPDFHSFVKAGRALAELHLGYETCAEHPLEVIPSQPGELERKHFRLGARAMRFDDEEKITLRINDHVSLRGIPASAHKYQVNGRTPLEWFIDRYRIVQDKQSGIVNDPNGWFDDPRDLVNAIRRIVYLSVETTRIVEGLPEPFDKRVDAVSGEISG